MFGGIMVSSFASNAAPDTAICHCYPGRPTGLKKPVRKDSSQPAATTVNDAPTTVTTNVYNAGGGEGKSKPFDWGEMWKELAIEFCKIVLFPLGAALIPKLFFGKAYTPENYRKVLLLLLGVLLLYRVANDFFISVRHDSSENTTTQRTVVDTVFRPLLRDDSVRVERPIGERWLSGARDPWFGLCLLLFAFSVVWFAWWRAKAVLRARRHDFWQAKDYLERVRSRLISNLKDGNPEDPFLSGFASLESFHGAMRIFDGMKEDFRNGQRDLSYYTYEFEFANRRLKSALLLSVWSLGLL
jgi:hypothetical protein